MPLWFMVVVSVLMGITGWISAGPGSVDDELVPAGDPGGTGEGN